MGEPARKIEERRAAILALPLRPEPLTEEEEAIFRDIEEEAAATRGAQAPMGAPLTAEERVALDASMREMAAGARGYTNEEVLEMIVQDARADGATEEEIQQLLAMPARVNDARRTDAVGR